MKQNLFNKLWLRVGMIVAIMTTALSGTVWAETYTFNSSIPTSGWKTAGGTQTINGVAWTYSSSTYIGYSSPRLQVGSKNNPQTSAWTIQTPVSSFGENKKITAISITAYTTAQTATYDISAGGSSVQSGSLTTSSATYTASDLNVTSGNIVITLQGSSNSKAMYLYDISVTYTTTGSSAVATTTTIDASDITNTDVYTSTAAGFLSATVKDNNNATISGATVTWSSSDEDVATIAADGTVTLVAAGTTTITASYAGVANQYQSSSDTYELTVTDSSPFSGGDVTFDAKKDKDSNNTSQGSGSITKKVVTFSCDNGILGNGTEYRMYKNSVTTLSVSEGTITQIAFTGVSGNPASGFATQTGWTTDGNNGTWTGSATSVTFTASGAQVRATQIVVTVDLSGTPEPAITVTNDEINAPFVGLVDYLAISYNDLDIDDASDFGVQFYDADGNAISRPNWIPVAEVTTMTGEEGYFVYYNVDYNDGAARAAYFKVYSGTTYSNLVTINQDAYVDPVNYTTIPELFAAATSTPTDVIVTFDSWVVSGVSGSNVFLTDNQGNGLIIYGSGHGFQVGDVLTGTASCRLQLYKGSAELKNLTSSTEGLSVAHNGTVTAANIAMASLAGVNTGALVSYENLTCSVNNSKYYLTDGTTTLQVYNTLYAFDELEDGKTYNITGVYQQFDSTKEILPRSAADIEEVEDVPPTPVTGDKYVKVTSTDDLTDGQYLIVYEEGSVAFNGGLETLDAASNTIEVVLNNNEIAATSATTAAEFTIDVTAGTIQSASGKYIYASTYNNELKTSTSVPTQTNTFSFDSGNAVISVLVNETQSVTLRYNSASNQTRFRYYKTGQEAIQLYKKVEAPITVTVGDALYTTYVAPVAVSFPDDVTAYIVTSKTETAVTLTEKASVPAGTPVVVKATEAGTYALTTTTTPESVDGNLLRASDGNVQGGEGIYALSTLNGTVPVGFYPVGNDTNGDPVVIPAGKAYLYISGGNVKGYTFDFDDDATGISNLNVDLNANEAIYNLAGQRLQKMQKGINIVNGKKVLK